MNPYHGTGLRPRLARRVRRGDCLTLLFNAAMTLALGLGVGIVAAFLFHHGFGG